jgi:hypothetical protein
MRQMQAELSFGDSNPHFNSVEHVMREAFQSADFTFHNPLPEPKGGRMKVTCLECGRKWRTTSFIPTCPGCGGSDVELA